MIDLLQIRRILQARDPVVVQRSSHQPASVAMILLQDSSELEVLFIERAPHPNDPWSGNLAFPGGRVDPDDADSRATAERECREEIGLDLSRVEWLGRLDDIVGAYLPVTVSCFVYQLPELPELSLNHEVTRVFQYPIAELCNPSRHTRTELIWQGRKRHIQGIRLADNTPLLWGITYRLVIQLLSRLDKLDPALLAIKDD
jgi:8-oxo-dGTP pyrophosphatase MutT (NUDIX family)